jgi:hypothetical protein
MCCSVISCVLPGIRFGDVSGAGGGLPAGRWTGVFGTPYAQAGESAGASEAAGWGLWALSGSRSAQASAAPATIRILFVTAISYCYSMTRREFAFEHDVAPSQQSGTPLPYFMYPQGESDRAALDSLDPDAFTYAITAREISTT